MIQISVGLSILFICLLSCVSSLETNVNTVNATVTDTLAITVTLSGTDYVMKVELFGNVVPNTVANFKNLCLNANTVKTYQNSAIAKNYNNSKIYKILAGHFAVMGDMINNDGTCGEANNGMLLMDENFVLKHEAKYLLSMVRTGEHRANSNFIITFGILPFLDGQQTVFGRVKSDSTSTADMIEKLSGKTYDGTPTTTKLLLKILIFLE